MLFIFVVAACTPSSKQAQETENTKKDSTTIDVPATHTHADGSTHDHKRDSLDREKAKADSIHGHSHD